MAVSGCDTSTASACVELNQHFAVALVSPRLKWRNEISLLRRAAAAILGMSADLIELRGEACVLTALTDITERKQAEAVLARYHLLSERARDIMLFIRPDRLAGIVTSAMEAIIFV